MLNKFKNVLLNYRNRYNNEINYQELKKMTENPEIILIDVRSPQEYNEGHLPNAINIPLYEIDYNIDKYNINFDDVIILYCQMGGRSKKAWNILKQKGYKNLYNLKGGIDSI